MRKEHKQTIDRNDRNTVHYKGLKDTFFRNKSNF